MLRHMARYGIVHATAACMVCNTYTTFIYFKLIKKNRSNWNVAHTADRANDINVSRVHRVHHYVFTPTPTNVWSRVVQHKSIQSLMHQVLRKPLLVAATTYNVYVGATSKNVQLHMDGTVRTTAATGRNPLALLSSAV